MEAPTRHGKRFVGLSSLLLLLALAGCRGEIRNPAALTPLASPEAIAPPTSTVLPSPTVPPTATPVVVLHTVQPGDTLLGIAVQYNSTVEAIEQANGLAPGAILQVGQQLQIPQQQ
ncbi:MAG TPA: LysM peptidoglycan-binding domain-containing protein [Ardenticatenaceae bacterium]